METPSDRNGSHVSETIIEALAEARGVAPRKLSPPLYEAVDPESLEALLRSSADVSRVCFEYDGYGVTVAGDGDVDVEPLSETP